MPSNRKLAFGAIASGTVNVVKAALQLLLLPVMARLLGPDEFGVYALALPTVSFRRAARGRWAWRDAGSRTRNLVIGLVERVLVSAVRRIRVWRSARASSVSCWPTSCSSRGSPP